jgi:hypothetical protein
LNRSDFAVPLTLFIFATGFSRAPPNPKGVWRMYAPAPLQVLVEVYEPHGPLDAHGEDSIPEDICCDDGPPLQAADEFEECADGTGI